MLENAFNTLRTFIVKIFTHPHILPYSGRNISAPAPFRLVLSSFRQSLRHSNLEQFLDLRRIIYIHHLWRTFHSFTCLGTFPPTLASVILNSLLPRKRRESPLNVGMKRRKNNLHYLSL